MKWFIFALIFVTACGPVRKWFYSNWRFTIPAVLGGCAAWALFPSAFPSGNPWWALPVVVLLAAFGIGVNAKLWLDEVFRRKD